MQPRTIEYRGTAAITGYNVAILIVAVYLAILTRKVCLPSVSDKDSSHPSLHTVSSLRPRGTPQPDPRQSLLVDSHAPIHGTAVPTSTLSTAITTLPLQDKVHWESVFSKFNAKAVNSKPLFTPRLHMPDSLSHNE